MARLKPGQYIVLHVLWTKMDLPVTARKST